MKDSILLKEEHERYERQLLISDFTEEDQLKLKAAKVLVIGAGGLGSPLLYYLAASGVGNITILDGDTVSPSNLNRQILYTTSDLDKQKAEIAKEKLSALNPTLKINAVSEYLTDINANESFTAANLIADCSDNFQTRYLINDKAIKTNKTFVSASIFEYEGRLGVFNFPLKDGTRSANYRDLFPEAPEVNEKTPNGVIGVIAGVMGALQASEIIKIITVKGEPLVNQYLIVDALSMEFRRLKFAAE